MLDTLFPSVKEPEHTFFLILSDLSAQHYSQPMRRIKSRALSAMSEKAPILGKKRGLPGGGFLAGVGAPHREGGAGL